MVPSASPVTQKGTVLAESTTSPLPQYVEILPPFSQCPGELSAGPSLSLQAACWQEQPPASGALRYEQRYDVLSKIQKQAACSLRSSVIWSCKFVLSFLFPWSVPWVSFFSLLLLLIFSSVRVRFFVCARWGAGRGRQCPSDVLLGEGQAGMRSPEPSSPASKTGFPPQLSDLDCQGLAQANPRARPLLHRDYGAHQQCYSIPPVLLRSAEPHKEQIKAPILSSWALGRKSLPKCI